jgi:2-oxoglutarate dehydrogenase complex dehydrogenase (E1) component-like enzyme
MIGFRKYGHNEVDEPAFTQPRMYEVIRSMKPVSQAYADSLI